MTWFSNADTVTHEVTVSESNAIYRALDVYADRFDDGPTRAALDRLLAQISRDNARASLIAQGQSEARGGRALDAIKGDLASCGDLLAALDRRNAKGDAA